MGVYVKNMEMPKSCWDCYFQDCGNCRLNANKVVDKCIIEDRRDDDCPLVPVPPHGRSIDADALLSLLNKCMFPSDMVTTTAVRMATNWIKDAPTVIPAEESERC